MRQLLPGVWVRLFRHGRTLIGLVVASALAISMGGFERISYVRVDEVIDDSWRGAYDLLVRGEGQRTDAERTGGFVEPNFLSFAGAGGLTLQDVAAIAALENVELAAPIATLGLIRGALPRPLLWADKQSLPDSPTEYRLRWRATVNDGLKDRVLASDTVEVILGPLDADIAQAPVSISGGGEASWSDYGVTVALGSMPEVHHLLVAVDPDAEQRLLGETAPISFAGLRLIDDSSRTLSAFDEELLEPEFVAEQMRLLAQRADLEAGTRRDGPVIPVVVADRLPARLELSLDVERGGVVDEIPDATGWQTRSMYWEQVGESSLNLSDRVQPFTTPEVTTVWPGSHPPDDEEVLTGPPVDLDVSLLTRPNYHLVNDDADRFILRAAPGPLVTTVGTDARADAEAERTERSYRDLAEPIGDVVEGPVLLAPIGRFGSAEPELGVASSHAPLGLYGSSAAEVVGQRHVLRSTLNPRGLLTPSPMAYTDMLSATELRGARAVDAVRVRLGGIDRYGPNAVRRVEEVATAIRNMGHDVDVVAGASLQLVRIEAPDYAPDADAAPLVVEQPWTTLGAATRVEHELGVTSAWLRRLGLLAAFVLVPALQVSALSLRHRERLLLFEIGWTRARIRRWYLAEAGTAAAIIGVAVGVTLWLRPAAWDDVLVALIVAALLPLTTAVWLVAAPRSSGRWTISARRSRPGIGLTGLSIRELVRRPLRPMMRGAVIVLFAVGVGGAVTVLGSLRSRLGPSELARTTAGVTSAWYLAMLAAIAVASLVLVALLGRVDGDERRRHRELLRGIGIADRLLRRGDLLQEFALTSVAAPLAVVGLMLLGSAAQLDVTTAAVATVLGSTVAAGIVSHRARRTA